MGDEIDHRTDENSAETEQVSSELRRRAVAVYGSFLVRVKVLDETTGNPIRGAQVELNEIETVSDAHEESKILDVMEPEPRLSLPSATDDNGLTFYSLPDPCTRLYSLRTVHVVSATADGYETKHVTISYPRLAFLRMKETVEWAVVLQAEEVGEVQPSEDLTITLRSL